MALVEDVRIFVDNLAIGVIDADVTWTFAQVREHAIAEGLEEVKGKFFIANIMESDVKITESQESRKKWSKYYSQQKIVMASKEACMGDTLSNSPARPHDDVMGQAFISDDNSGGVMGMVDGSEILKMVLMFFLRALLTVTHYTQVVIQATSKWETQRTVQGSSRGQSSSRLGQHTIDPGRRVS
jgi:hypothetical protein